jgi:Domain of unknown function (DUF4260)
MPKLLLQAEGLALLFAAVVVYADAGFSWVAFLVLFLAPDLSFVGYAVNTKVGALAYNLVHNLVLPLALGAIGVVADADIAIQVALIWLAHIGIDRMLGFGLKYPTDFKDSHLQRV